MTIQETEKTVVITDDCVQPFSLGDATFRGRYVRLGDTLNTILQKHAYPVSVGTLLAETVAVACALAFSLKYEGKFTLQSKGDGAIKLLVADVRSDGGIRAYAQFDEAEVMRMGNEGIGLLGKGYLAFTVDQGDTPDRDTYQGIVELRGASIAEATQYYFRQSEQIPTALIAGAHRDELGQWRGGALMLQSIPQQGGASPKLIEGSETEDRWHHAMMLMSTCKADELASPLLSPNDLLFRLFHEDGVRITPPRPLHHQCQCGDRVHQTLRLFGQKAVEDMADAQGIVSMSCQFCNASYQFDALHRARLFAPDNKT